MDIQNLIDCAAEVLQNSYSPYSNFKVGAALLTKSGRVFSGCNVENTSLGATVCAERTAFFKAVSEGETEFEAILITAVDKSGKQAAAYPCGICLQVMAQFCKPDFKIILDQNNKAKTVTLSQLLPNAFTGEQLK